MKTRFALSAVVGLVLLMSGNIVWAQGRGNGREKRHDNGDRGGNGRGNQQHHNRGNDQNHRDGNDRHHHTDYSYQHNHHHVDHKKVVYVHHHRPVERVVVVHHHNRHYEPRYVYYRDYDVYYDTHRGVYITFSGRRWSFSTEIPVKMYYVDRATIVSSNVNYYDDDFPVYLDSRRPGGRHCDEW